MKITKCDRCGKELKFKEGFTLKPEERHETSFYVEIDLCDKCMKSFRKWLKDAKQKTNNRRN